MNNQKEISTEQLETRKAVLIEKASKLHKDLQGLLNLYRETAFFTPLDILKIQRELISNVLSLEPYLDKSKSKMLLFIIYSINNSINIPNECLSVSKICYFHTTSLELARQCVNYYILLKIDKVVCKEEFLNIPYFK